MDYLVVNDKESNIKEDFVLLVCRYSSWSLVATCIRLRKGSDDCVPIWLEIVRSLDSSELRQIESMPGLKSFAKLVRAEHKSSFLIRKFWKRPIHFTHGNSNFGLFRTSTESISSTASTERLPHLCLMLPLNRIWKSRRVDTERIFSECSQNNSCPLPSHITMVIRLSRS